MCGSVGVHTPCRVCAGQRTVCANQISPTLWDMGTKLRLSVLATPTFTHEAILPPYYLFLLTNQMPTS